MSKLLAFFNYQALDRMQQRAEMSEHKLSEVAHREQELSRTHQALIQEHIGLINEYDRINAEKERLRRDLAEAAQQLQTPRHSAALQNYQAVKIQLDQALETIRMLESAVARLKEDKERLLQRIKSFAKY